MGNEQTKIISDGAAFRAGLTAQKRPHSLSAKKNNALTSQHNKQCLPWSELSQILSEDSELAAWVLGTPHDGLHFTQLQQKQRENSSSETFCESLWDQLGFTKQDLLTSADHAEQFLGQKVKAIIRRATSPRQTLNNKTQTVHYLDRNGQQVPFKRAQRVVQRSDGLVTGIIAKLTRCELHAIEQNEPENIESEHTTLKAAMELSQQKLLNFTSIASHDLQAPLRHINGMVQLLLIRNEDVLDEKSEQLIHRTIQSVETLQHLIDDLLMNSQVDSKPIRLEPLAMHRVCGKALDLLSATIEDSGAKIECDFLPTLHADQSMMVHLMQNLISNGIKYCGNSSPSIVINSEQHSGHWTISVQDNGIGIDPQEHERIFDSFKRLHSQSSYSGTGLGLSICKTIVERHGGSIHVESAPGEGSRFYFNIPKREI